jgi:integral membrane protein
MAVMTSAYDLRTAAGWFRLIAFAEAVSWAGLLIGMYFKYLGSPQTEVGVKVFGPIHGGIFIAFLVAAAVVGIGVKWRAGTWLLALLGSIVPLGSVMFLIWADRTGRMGSGAVGVRLGQPEPSVPETT